MSRLRPFAAVGAAAVLTGAVVLIPAQGQEPNSTPSVPVPAGVLTVQTGVVDRVALDENVDGTPEKTQALNSAKNCLLATDESLLAIDGFVGTGTTDKASFASNSIGVAEKTSGTSCYQVGAPNERLVLKLNGANLKSDLGPTLASSAYLDVELKGDARLVAVAKRDGEAVGTFELRSGRSVGTTTPLPGGVVPDEVFNCRKRADSGPDSGDCDNCSWPISMPSWLGADDNRYFDSLEISAVSGTFSLEGGSDGKLSPTPAPPLPQSASFFELITLADGTLPCVGQTETLTGSGTKPEVTVRRLGNADPAEECELIPYTLRNGDSSARFLKPLDRQTGAQFVFDMVWSVPAEGSSPLPVTKVDFESGGTPDGVALQWCPDPVYDGDTLVGIVDPLTNPAAPDLDPVLDGKQFACLATQDAQVVDGESDSVQVAEQVYVLGDVFLRK